MSRREQQDDLLDLVADAISEIRETAYGKGQRVAAVISGGLDSSTVKCIAGDIPTFTGYYADGPAYDEREWAHLVKGTEHHDIVIGPQDFVDFFDAMIQAVAPPYQGPGTFGQYMVGRYIAYKTDPKVVVLSGEGADELFGGYARQMIVAGEPPPKGYEYYRLPDGYPTDIAEALAYDYERLPLLLAVDDQCMAAHGLKAEAPFTDPQVVEFALNLPVTDRIGKRYLREAVRGVVPDAIIDRTDKRGFPAPFVKWAQTDPVKTFVADRIGYVPDPDRPWDRAWWLELCSITRTGKSDQQAA